MAGVGIAASGMMMMAHPGGALQSTTHQMQQQQEWVPLLITKRIASWKYLGRVFQGGMVLYNTAMVTEQEMRQFLTEEKIQRRSMRFFFLGTSLATILEIPSTMDCIKALYHVLHEYEHFATTESRAKSIFFALKGTADAFDDTGEYSYLEVRSIPFIPDYVITASSLCGIIAQVYEKLNFQLHQEYLWPMLTIETFQKVDTRFKRILTTVYKEFEIMARDVMLEELNVVDPLGSSLHDYGWDL
ncbi:hypothetical protein EDD21DRAFT_376117 [Dissophora ornata]|nr:hypothetical protein EDD21DRAFT_376117 [Dissophora ornata]